MSLQKDLKSLKARLENIEEEINTTIVIEQKQNEESLKQKLKKEALENILKKESTVTINIGGKLFKCSSGVLKSSKGSLFEELYKDEASLKEVYFVDRSYDHFDIILNFLRSRIFNPSKYNRVELEEIKNESDYYAIDDLSKILNEVLCKIDFVSFESSAKYSNCGTHKVEDLSTKDLNTGICVGSTYYITVELNFEHEFEKIEIAGWTGNSSSWAPSNGANATILTSTDKINFKEVGKIPSNYGASIITVSLKKSTAKYIKFQHNAYLGLGYLNIIKS